MMTSEEYAELNELRRYKAAREEQDAKLKEASDRLSEIIQAIRKTTSELKRSHMPDGGGR
jgi:signal transduction histidine kinase